ncbi:MAG: LolA family protein [Sphingomonadaceae bacterium]
MAGSEFETMERLNEYWDEIVRGTEGVPDRLDAPLAGTVRMIHALDDAPAPDPAFARRLWQELADEPATPERLPGPGDASAHRSDSGKKAHGPQPERSITLSRKQDGRARVFLARRPLAGIAAALVMAIAVGGYLVATQPAPVSAEEIVRKAQEAVLSPAAAGVNSFVSTERSVSRPVDRMKSYEGYSGNEEIRSETKRWYEAPNRWRIEAGGSVIDTQGNELPNRTWRWLSVSDGRDVWRYNITSNEVTVHQLAPPPSGKIDSFGAESTLGQGTIDPGKALQTSNPNVRPKLQGEERVAGRDAYVLAFPPETRSASAPELNGPRTVWVDKETFFVLKAVQYSGVDGKLLSTTEVTSVQYNPAIDPALFGFTPPAGAKLDDQRPKPAPTKAQFQQQMEALARQADFPLFLPSQVPNGLVPRQTRMDPALGLQLEYTSPSETDKDSFATMRIVEQKATQGLVSRWIEGAESASIGDTKGWLRRGFRNVDGTGMDSSAMLLRDGTLISVSSFTLSPEELLGVAASLVPVPGGHAPLPNPTAPSMDKVRQRASFKVFLPEYVPAGLTPEPPVAGSNQGSDRIDALNVIYHSADGAVALRLVEGPPRDPSSMARPMLTAPEVTIKPGVTGRMMDASSVQTLLLWWVQDGTYISLETRVLSREELLKVAASMSPTAGQGRVEPVAGRPTPTPVPAPSFNVLRPTWLPEQMAVREQFEPDPTGKGTQVVIGFDPRPEDPKPHSVLMLTEMSKEAMPSGVAPDPEETRETIGGRQVRVISRGEDWITLTWVQGDVALTLTNPYDPPGQPRYTPDQLRKIVESIR